MAHHDLKIWPEFFVPIVAGEKTFEVRRDDRQYREGDTLMLREWNLVAERYTGRTTTVTVTYVARGGGRTGIEHGFVVLALTPTEPR